MTEDELDEMLGEVGGACNYDNMVKMFQTKMAGEGNDPDDLIVQAFKAYDIEGKIDAGMFKHALMTWGDKFSASEVDDIFGEFEIDEDNMIKSKDVIGLFVAQNERQSLRKMRAQPRRRRRRRRPPSKAFIHINAPVITRIPQNHLSPRGGRSSVLVSTKKIHFQKKL